MNVFNVIRASMLSGLALFAFSAFSACEATVDLDPLSSHQCPEGQKACETENICVPKNLPSKGCALNGCAPCPLPNAIPRCSTSGQCIIATCQTGWDNCDMADSNGCEQNIKDGFKEHCGGCNKACEPIPNGEPTCAGGRCGVGSCNSGFQDCDNDLATGIKTGCETDIMKDAHHCGTCDNDCTKTPSTPFCSAGACSATAPPT